MNELNLNNRSVLFKVAEEIPQDEDVSELIKVMRRILNKAKGLGLAAPQIGESKRIILAKTGTVVNVIINPVITRRRLGKTNSIEGCLSFPGFTTKVRRDKQIVVEGFDEKWKPVKYKLRGLDSFVIQHEIDHLNGITLKNKKQ